MKERVFRDLIFILAITRAVFAARILSHEGAKECERIARFNRLWPVLRSGSNSFPGLPCERIAPAHQAEERPRAVMR